MEKIILVRESLELEKMIRKEKELNLYYCKCTSELALKMEKLFSKEITKSSANKLLEESNELSLETDRLSKIQKELSDLQLDTITHIKDQIEKSDPNDHTEYVPENYTEYLDLLEEEKYEELVKFKII